MNAKQLYLAWVRTNHPHVYRQALQMALRPQSGLGGLGDDLTDSIVNSGTDASSQITGLSDADAANLAAAADAANAQGNSWTDLFTGLANAIGSVAPVIVQTQAQQNLLSINTQRARQGLPPLSANGQLVTAASLAPANSTTAKLEAALSGGGGFALVAGLAVLGIALALGSRHG